jgi:hypothetical protein
MTATELDPEEAMFLSVIYSFHAAAMQQMGKVANPFTGEIERNLGAARGAIDTLMVIQKRTQGNLTDLEERSLNSLIHELQLNYVDEAKRGEELITEPTEPEAAPETEPEEPEEPAAETTEEAPEDVDVAWLEKEKEKAEEEPEIKAEEKPKKKTKKKKAEKKKD